MRKPLLAVAAVLVTAVATVAAVIAITPAAQAAGPPRVVRWVDGDTVVTTKGEVRLIGVDTPERGRCGYLAATRHARQIAPKGSIIRLGNPASVMNQDRYGRLLRYVNRGARDLSAAQIKHGARARYDSRDGYQWHPRQPKYRALDRVSKDYKKGSCLSGSSSGGGSTGGGSSSGGSWQEKVNRPGPDIDCGDIPDSAKPVRITGPDYHGLDSDGDGWGCDS